MVINSHSILNMEKSKQRKQCPELQKDFDHSGD